MLSNMEHNIRDIQLVEGVMLVIVDCIWHKPMSTYAISVSHWWLR